MLWFLKEQVEEVASMSTLLNVAQRAGSDWFDVETYLARESVGDVGGRRRRRRRAAAEPAAAGRVRRRRAGDDLPADASRTPDRLRRRAQAGCTGP